MPTSTISVICSIFQIIGNGVWIGRAVINQTYDLDILAEYMANHNTPYSKGAIYGVLTNMVNCIRELVLDGKAVKIPNLSILTAIATTLRLTSCM